ncbi:hypothetical protein AS850_09975 [Frondihabitans sp. 762G35]|uniref:DUF4129 domain-containing protein n=1 Tax=Frondihabitans sp. 762G35 TaxID=1446794 RepID=UPI000D219EF9|nr:DUF4129 domain-containing protein [Frondihabitans sp. 762G35]ARC57402.1 hypothetical protein AS850_09975 [Frondihabitans sp. 762G35]
MSAPLTPSADEARRLLVTELAKPEYASAQPSLLDRIAAAIMNWIGSLRFGSVQGAPAFLLVALLVLVAVAVVVLVLVYGVPRRRRRSAVESALFGDDDSRSADALRGAAAAAARSGDFAQATVETFRAIARDLAERGALTTAPGTTAQTFATRTAALFPEHSDAVLAAGRSFDEVRYLDRPGSEADFERVRDLDRALQRATIAAVPA